MKRIKFLAFILSLLVAVPSFAQDASLVKSVVSLTGNVYNEITKQPETVALIVYDEEGNKVTSTRSIVAENGLYYMTGLKQGKKYTVRIKKKDFFEEIWNLNVPSDGKYVELSHDFLVKPLEINAMIPIGVPPFELNKSKMRVGAEELLEDLKTSLSQNNTVKFEIVCYPDNSKDANANLKLTEERANALLAYFKSKGIDASRITASGNKTVDSKNPPPSGALSKGKRYIGTSYIKVITF